MNANPRLTDAIAGQVEDWLERLPSHPSEITAQAAALLREMLRELAHRDARYREQESIGHEIERILAGFSALYDLSPVAYLTVRHDGGIARANLAAAKLLGFQRAHLRHLKLETFMCEASRPIFRAFIEQVFASRVEQSCEVDVEAAEPHPQRRLQVIAVEDEMDRTCNLVLIDVTQRVTAELKLKELSSIVEHSADPISLAAPDGAIRYVNPAFERLCGYAAAELVGRNFSVLGSGKQDRAFYERLWTTIRSGAPFQGHMVNRRKDGSLFHIFKTITPIVDADGAVVSYTSVDKDFDAEMLAREKIERLALHDPLTGLANRALFADRIEQAIARAVRERTKFALFYVDLDDFKPINDRFGHAGGDRVLQEVAVRLETSRRETDTVARLGGDEFAILLQDVSSAAHAMHVARDVIAALNRPVDLGGAEGRIGASIGISLFPDHGEDSIAIARHADEAMYQAKNLGKNRAVCYGCTCSGACADACLCAAA